MKCETLVSPLHTTRLSWAAAITTELGKFRDHNCLIMASYTSQHLVAMEWIYSIKTDGTYKARLVGRDDLMIPWIDFNPKEIYCGNITACGIKLVFAIAASYKLRMRGGDLVGAYLVTRANKDCPVFIKTPKGMEVEEGLCIQAALTYTGFLEQDRTSRSNSISASRKWDTRILPGISSYTGIQAHIF